MSFTFTKLSSDIIHSSVWCEPMPTKIVWITLLAMADQYGRVGAAVPGLAKAAGVTIEEAQTALDKFLAADPWSRTPDHEGRRIEKIDGGWRLINYGKNRDQRDEEHRRQQNAKYQATYRERQKAKVSSDLTVSAHVRESEHIAEAEPEAECLASQLAGASPALPQKPEPASEPPASSPVLWTRASQRASEPPTPYPSHAFVEQLAAMVTRLTSEEQDLSLEHKESSRLGSLETEANLESILTWALRDKYWSEQMLDKPADAMKVFIRAFDTIKSQAKTPRNKKPAAKTKPKADVDAQWRKKSEELAAKKAKQTVRAIDVPPTRFKHKPTGEIVTAYSINEPNDGTMSVLHADGARSIVSIYELEEMEVSA